MFSLRTFSTLSVVALLAACGGGGGSDPDGGGDRCAELISFTPYWTSNGVASQRVDGKVGVPLVATLELRDLSPPQCVGEQVFALGAGVVLPQGLVLNTTTGTISGTPTEVKEIAGLNIVEARFPGFLSGTGVLSILDIRP